MDLFLWCASYGRKINSYKEELVIKVDQIVFLIIMQLVTIP